MSFLDNIKNIAKNIGSSINNFKTDLPANLAYGQAKVAQAIAPKFQVPTPQQNKTYFNSPVGQFESKNWGALESLQKPIQKSLSAQVNKYPVVQPTLENIKLEAQKQTILNSGAFRPAMSRFLSTVPVNYEPDLGKGSGMTDMTTHQRYDNVGNEQNSNQWERYQGSYQPVIAMGDTNNTSTVVPSKQENLSPVLAHELVHAAPRNMKYKNDFMKVYKGLTPESNPILFKSAATYLMNGNKPPNAEELYATLAQNMGTKVLQIPEIRKFYENLYK